MPIDSSIYGQFAPRVRSPLDVQNGLQQAEGGALALQAGRMNLAERQNALANAPALQAQAAAEHAAKLEKIKAETNQANSHAGSFDADAALKKLHTTRDGAAYLAQRVPGLKSDEDIANWYKEGVQRGVVSPEQAMAEINKVPPPGPAREAWKAQQAQMGMSVVEQTTKALEQTKQQEQVRQFGITSAETQRNHKVNEGIAGGHLAISRAAEGRAAAAPKGTYDSERGLIVDTRSGETKPVTANGAPIGPKEKPEKPLTDAQSKAALFGSRMEASNKVLAELEKAGTTTSVPGARTGFGVGATLNVLSSAKQQQLNQAKRDFVNAVLRRESGAVIADSEFSNAEQQYFPQVGDSDAVIKQKANNRAIAIRGVQAEVPKGQRGVLDEIQGGASGGWSGFDAEKEKRYQEWKAKQK